MILSKITWPDSYRNFYKNENLILIGGLQNTDYAKEITLIFYRSDMKFDAQNNTSRSIELNQWTGELSTHVIEGDEALELSHTEMLVNEQQMEARALRSVITFTEGTKRSHYFIFQESKGEALYSVSGFPNYLRDEQEEINKSSEVYRKNNEKNIRENFASKMSKYMSQYEAEYNFTTLEAIINSHFDDSYVIYQS